MRTNLDDPVYIPEGWSAAMANGDTIDSNKHVSEHSFILPGHLDDPMYPEARVALDQGQDPTFNSHRLWAQAEVALANAVLGQLSQKFAERHYARGGNRPPRSGVHLRKPHFADDGKRPRSQPSLGNINTKKAREK